MATKKKDPAAVALGRKRWKDKTPAAKRAHAEMMNEARTVRTTPAQRKKSAKKAAAARWDKKRGQ